MELPTRMSSWRRAKGVSQAACARACDVGPPSVSMWESGSSRPTVENLEKYVVAGLHETMQRFYDDEALAAALAEAPPSRASKAS